LSDEVLDPARIRRAVFSGNRGDTETGVRPTCDLELKTAVPMTSATARSDSLVVRA
jgi:hypothetical protein